MGKIKSFLKNDVVKIATYSLLYYLIGVPTLVLIIGPTGILDESIVINIIIGLPFLISLMISYFLGVRFSRGTIDRKRVIKIILSLSIFPLSLLTLGFILFRSRGDTLGQPYLIHNTNVLIVIAFIDIVACIALLIINALFSFVGNFVGQLTKPQS